MRKRAGVWGSRVMDFHLLLLHVPSFPCPLYTYIHTLTLTHTHTYTRALTQRQVRLPHLLHLLRLTLGPAAEAAAAAVVR